MSSKKKEKPRSFPVVMNTSAERRKALEDKEAAKEKEAAATADVMKMAHIASKSDSGSPQRRPHCCVPTALKMVSVTASGKHLIVACLFACTKQAVTNT